MWSRNQRQSATRLFFRRLGMVGLFALVVLAISGVSGVYKKERESRALRAQAQRDHEELQERHSKLEEDIADLKTDRGLEEILRKQYALAEEGEKLIVIVDPPTATSHKATSTLREFFQKAFWWW